MKTVQQESVEKNYYKTRDRKGVLKRLSDDPRVFEEVVGKFLRVAESDSDSEISGAVNTVLEDKSYLLLDLIDDLPIGRRVANPFQQLYAWW